MKIKSVLSANDTILQVVSKFRYQDALCDLMKSLKEKRVCYISLNKPAERVCDGLDKKKISTVNTFFIDAVSASVGDNLEKSNVLYVSSPSALTELSIAIVSALKGNSFDAFVFDSISTLDIYNLGSESERFLRKIVHSINSKQCKGVFVCLEDDIDCSLVKNSVLSMDTVYQPHFQKSVRSLGTVAAFLAFVIGLPLLTHTGKKISLSSPTAFAVLESGAVAEDSLAIPKVFLYASIIVASAFFVYRRHFLDPLPDGTLLRMTGKSQKGRLSMGFVKEKIKQWRKKH